MIPKVRNIIIFVIIAAILALAYIFVIKPQSGPATLVSSTVSTTTSSMPGNTNGTTSTDVTAPASAQDFLNLLLNVQNIKLDDSIFSDPAFLNLHDSSIVLTQDGHEGRPNPFAPIGTDIMPPAPVTVPTCTAPQVLDTTTNTCVNPVPTCVAPQILDSVTNTCVTPVTCKSPKVLDSKTNTCVTPVTCKAPKVLDSATNTCVTPTVTCTAPKILDKTTNTCVTPTSSSSTQ